MSEIIRRMKTSHQDTRQVDMEEILLDLMDELQAMGYNEEWRADTLK